MQVIVDGVDITPTAYTHTLTNGAYPGNFFYWMSASAPVGGAAVKVAMDSAGYFLLPPVFERASVPVPFNSSLEVNLVHISSTSALYLTSCWVNAWLTK
ncbi:hypothetical protein LDC_3036 [sediment metagenome]|uniref:Uncharacterized protein n=1 Tax=sediment metagenome TaxID=749907 RepID=D9PNA5_9ZZZZ